MAGLFLIAHAPLASSLKAVAQHVFPDCAASLEALDVVGEMAPEEIEARAKEALARLGSSEVLILTDVFGATPCNVARKLADGVHVKVLAGVNVPMLWRSLCYSAEPLEALVARAMAGATQGVMQVTTAPPQNQTAPRGNDNNHDQVERHHQQ